MKLSTRITVFSLAFTLAIPPFAPRTILAAEGTILSKVDTEIIPGFTYSATTAQSTGGQVQSFTLTVDPDSTAFPITVQGSNVIYSSGNIESAIQHAENAGYHIIGAVNSDYFSMTTGVATGIVIENGVYKSSPSNFSSILFQGDDVTVLGATTIPIIVTNERTGLTVDFEHFNKFRSDTGGLYLLNRDFSSTTRTSSQGVMVRLRPTYEEMAKSGGVMTTNSTMEMTVVEVMETDYAWDIGDDDYILTAANQSGFRDHLLDFEEGDLVTVNVNCWDTAINNAQWASGGGDVMIAEGQLTNTSGWEHLTDGRNPRSAFGVKEDGTIVYYAVDGRQSSSVGLTQLELANHLLEEGCVYAVNLDGGGSTSFSVSHFTAPYTLSGATLVNSPSEGRLRNCSTFLLFADPRIPSQLMLESEVQLMLVGSSLDLGYASVRDVNKTHLEMYPGDTTLQGLDEIGTVTSINSQTGLPLHYYEAEETGLEILTFYSPSYDLSGEHHIEVVDSLTELYITQSQETDRLVELTVKPDTFTLFEPSAYLNGWDVHLNDEAVTWNIYPLDPDMEEDFGSINQEGFFHSGKEDCIIELTAGGQTTQLMVHINNMFEDVPEGHWAYDAIEYLSSNDIVSGFSDTEFGLGYSISRGDFVLMLYRAFDMPEVTTSVSSLFNDLSDSDYASDAISWAVANGIASGMGDGSFGTKNSITREQAAVIIHKGFLTMGVSLPTTAISTLGQYNDQHEISSYAMLSIASLTAQNLLGDTGDSFYPTTPLTRESMALYLYNMLHFKLEAQESPSQLSFQTSEVSLVSGESYSLLPILEPAGSGSAITWSSSDPSAVSVSSSGLVTNVFTGTGNPVVTVTATTGTVTTSCIVRCMPTGTATSNPSFRLPNLNGTDSSTSDDTLAYTGLVIDAPGGLNVRNAANSQGTVVTLLSDGQLINVHDVTDDGGWYLISTPTPSSTSNVQGYVMSQYIQQRNTIGTVDADVGLNLRAGAGTAFQTIGKLAGGSQVLVLQIFSEWYKVQAMIDGVSTTGFASAEYITLS